MARHYGTNQYTTNYPGGVTPSAPTMEGYQPLYPSLSSPSTNLVYSTTLPSAPPFDPYEQTELVQPVSHYQQP
jgi:hypothetical protein